MITINVTSIQTSSATIHRFTLPEKGEVFDTELAKLVKIVNNIINKYNFKWDNHLGVSATNRDKTTIGINAEIGTEILFLAQDKATIEDLFKSVVTFIYSKPFDMVSYFKNKNS